MARKHFVLFNNYNNYELFDEEKKSLQECNPEMVITDAIVWNSISEMEYEDWLECKRILNELFEGKVIAKGTCGTWQGTFDAIEIFDNIDKTIAAITKDCDYISVEYDCGDIKICASHHDGTNTFTIRVVNHLGRKVYANWGYNLGRNKHLNEYDICDKVWEKYSKRIIIKAVEDVLGLR